METEKTIITLLGRRAQDKHSVARPVNELPHSNWLTMFWKNGKRTSSAPVTNGTNKSDVFIRHAANEDLLYFNLPKLTPVLVTVYSLSGEILSIENRPAYRNCMALELGTHRGSYIVRVQLNYNRNRYAS